VNHTKYTLIISDIRTPQMSGFEFVRRIKQICHNINVVLVTAFEVDESEFATVFQSIKVDELVKKPVSSQQLLALAIKYISNTTTTE
jgi:CheY-like chemotaxis protein